MFRRMLLAISFVTALGVAGFAATDSAVAHGHGHGGHHGHYGHGYHGAYYGGGYGYYPHVYRTSYYPPIYYGAPAYYGRSYYGGYGGGCGDQGGVSLSIGF